MGDKGRHTFIHACTATLIGAGVLFFGLGHTSAIGGPATVCLPGSTGPNSPELDPHIGGMCDLGTLDGFSEGLVISANGAAIAGTSLDANGSERAFRWVAGDGLKDLGTLRSDGLRNSVATAISADGSVVVGRAANDLVFSRAFRWTEAGGMQDLGSFDGLATTQSEARAVSSDGAVVVGNANFTPSTGGTTFRAFRWTEAGGMQDLFAGSALSASCESCSSSASVVSANGAVVAGDARASPGGPFQAFRWTEASGLVILGGLPTNTTARESDVRAISDDGSVLAGFARNDANTPRAYRWTEAGGMQDLGTLRADNTGLSFSLAMSSNGDVVVGDAADANNDRAFRWTESGGMQDLGTLRDDNTGFSSARSVSADGSVVVGRAASDVGSTPTVRAFRWTEAGGMQDLGSLRTDGQGFSEARAVSADGLIVTGRADTDSGVLRAFIWRHQDAAKSAMEDFTNLGLSFTVLSNDNAVAVAEQQYAADQVVRLVGVASRTGERLFSARGSIQYTGRNPTRIESRTTGLSNLSFGYGVNEHWTLGASISLNHASLTNNAFDLGSGLGVGVSAIYSADSVARTGLQIRGGLGTLRSKADVSRGHSLSGVTVATGQSTLQTSALYGQLSYGFQSNNWLITPSFGLTHYKTTRSAYTENGASFNGSFAALRTTRSLATLKINSELAINTRSSVSVGLGIDREIRPAGLQLNGTSDIPGMSAFKIDSRFKPNRERPFATVGLGHKLGTGAILSFDLRTGRAVYGSTRTVGIGVNYSVRF